MTKAKILIQLDPDPHASVFDAVVAVDSGVERLLQYGAVEPQQVQGLVHGAIFTRSPQDLATTAIFIGGSNVAAGEALLKQVTGTFFGPMRVSVLLDANGANTTAAAAVLAAAKHVPLAGATAVVLGGTGPVGQRAARLLAREGAHVRVASRSQDESRGSLPGDRPPRRRREVDAAGSGVRRASDGRPGRRERRDRRRRRGRAIAAARTFAGRLPALKVAIDLNAVPPLGIAGVEVTDKAKEQGGVFCYGAIGVGGTKMKIHRAAIQKLFTANNLVLDAEEVFQIGREL